MLYVRTHDADSLCISYFRAVQIVSFTAPWVRSKSFMAEHTEPVRLCFYSNTLVRTLSKVRIIIHVPSLPSDVLNWFIILPLSMAPEYQEAAESLSPLIPFYNVDCDEQGNKALCAAEDIKGFPTVKVSISANSCMSERMPN
jgi:hypothetical protein